MCYFFLHSRLFTMVSMLSVLGIEKHPRIVETREKYWSLLLRRTLERGLFHPERSCPPEELQHQTQQQHVHEGLRQTLADVAKMGELMQKWMAMLKSL